MSFQGDVRGIGLAELLQGLARGRKEGVLTLTAADGHRVLIGLEEGQAHLLPEPREDPERWRTRARDAWAGETRVDYLRMAEIARAQRLEDLYTLLDGDGAHFRFDPGVLPRPSPAPGEESDQLPQVFCGPMQVEFLLLEYARIADELEGCPGALDLPSDLVPCLLDPAAVGGTPLQALEQCDGQSTLQEIADRLGWPIRQAQLTFLPALQAGGLRRAQSTELLHLALGELSSKRVSRAAVRLEAWCREILPGILDPELANLLEGEWLGGRLSAALRAMSGPARRTLLRRLDHALNNPSQTVVHWIEATRIDRTDRIARIKRMAAEFREGSDPDAPTVRDLLDWAREQRDAGHPWRAAPALVLASLRQPTNTTLQLELGSGLVQAGRILEGAPWILAGSRELIDGGHPDRTVMPLRTLLARDPRNRECRQLLSRARRGSSEVRKLRKNLLVGLGITCMLAGAALVKVRVDRRHERLLGEVRQALSEPSRALSLLDEHFHGDLSPEILSLREQIEERQRLDELDARSKWLSAYHAAQLEATKGDPLVAYERIRAVPTPPKLRLIREPWPDPKNLYPALVEHLRGELDALGEPVEGSPQQVAREDQIYGWAETLIVTVLSAEPVPPLLQEFAESLADLKAAVDERREERDARIEARLAQENLEKEDQLYRKGEAYARSGDLQRALNCWEEVVALDTTGKVKGLLDKRMAAARSQLEAIGEARRLAQEGKHEQAIALLEERLEDPTNVMLPWAVDSYPRGAHVSQGEDRIWTTPFTIETTLDEVVELTFEADGFIPRTLTIDRPGNRIVHLERRPERAFEGAGQIDAIPVPLDEDHLVVDRQGSITRIGAGGEVRWSQKIKTLSGFARAPVFMPMRPGHLLALTEDGDAWIVAAEDGRLEGPWQLGSAPRLGPSPSAGHVRARLADGRLVLWADALRPVLEEPGAPVQAGEEETLYGAEGGFSVHRRRAGDEGAFPCPWRDWVVEPTEDAYVVHPLGEPDGGYSILRHGDWTFIAWEAASAGAPQGRLWVSDGAGLRGFVPLEN